MKLENLLQLQNQFKLNAVTPVVLDYLRTQSELQSKGYTGPQLEDMTLTKLRVMYCKKRGLKQ